ncbi:uncharacterized protein LOC135497702 [Lineus longissimus]|uniref:uncharacterized protein LOC135497702 n=1 Tax=Lineus longissimus TaxID=88925 RepID=UPI00315CF871
MTRGVLAGELVSSKQWLSGPSWLAGSLVLGKDKVMFDQVERFLQPETVAIVNVARVWLPEDVLNVERWGTLEKAIRITAWVVRVLQNMDKTKQHVSGKLSLQECATAKQIMLKHVQSVAYSAEIEALKQGKSVGKSSPLLKLNPAIGKDGLVRIGGRLENSQLTYAEKHPVIVPKGRFATLLIRSEHFRAKHAGVEAMITTIRDNYWVIGLRHLAKAVKRSCVRCQRVDALACNQVAAPLPESRVHEAPVFSVTGLDFAGPVYCLDFPGHKFYILLFTCGVVRAIHLELTASLSRDDCVLALRRFMSRRGCPTILYSDNAKTFKATEKMLAKLSGSSGIKWKYIVPRSPWWGGWWERLVQSVKKALKKTVGNRCITRTELETSLCEIEACINDRPLTFVGDQVDGIRPLTPSHFLLGKHTSYQTAVSEDERVISQEILTESQLIRQRQIDLFWSVWSKDYVRNLPPTVNKHQAKGSLDIGHMVLIQEDNTPRMQWPIGVVTKLFPGRDGLVRSVELKTKGGTVVRSVQRLHDLEVHVQAEQDGDSKNITPLTVVQKKTAPSVHSNTGQGKAGKTDTATGAQSTHNTSNQLKDKAVKTRLGRVIKPKKRLDV